SDSRRRSPCRRGSTSWCAGSRSSSSRRPTRTSEERRMRDPQAREGTERPVRVSYVLSTRNRADLLDRALAGARELVGREDELIVVDGGSTDRTAAVVEAHADIVSVFLSEPDTGEAHGLNRGLLRARGRFIKQ